MKNATPFVELGYAVKSGSGSIIDSNTRVYHTGPNEVTFQHRGYKQTFHLDKLIALFGATAELPVGQAG